jgi:ATP-dependent protease ClpP protease subunit
MGRRGRRVRNVASAADTVPADGRPPVVSRSLDRMRTRFRDLRPADQQAPEPVRFWDIKAAATPDAADELWIYDQIGFIDWWTGEGITAQTFSKDLAKLKAKNLTLRVNSPGGDVFDGLAIKNMIASHARDKGVKVTARVDALAASIASVIIQAADEVVVEPHSQIMIHDASGFAMGNAAEMRDMADLLDMISQNIAQVYADAAGGSTDEWRKVMKGEKWYTAQEAVDAGLADAMGEAGPKRKTKCEACDGSGKADGEDCADCNGTGRVKPPEGDDGAPEDVRPLRVAARWCARLFPGHEQPFENVLADAPAEAEDDDEDDDEAESEPQGGPTDPALPAPAASAAGGTDAPPAVPVPPADTLPEPVDEPADEPVAFAWDASTLVGAVRAATAPPQIDLGDWRSFFAEAPAMPEPERNLPVDLGPVPARPAPVPNPARAPLAVGVDLGDWRNAFADMPELVAPAVPGPVDLGPAPARPAPDPAPVRNPLAEAIAAAVDITAKTQPEPDAPAAPAPELPEVPPIRLDVEDVRRAVREARY